jgi:LacI family transcriptional regulator
MVGGQNGRRRGGIREVAALAGVGVATVDRVLNERGSVRVETARRVIEAARSLGLRRTLPAPYVRRVRLDVLLARVETPFFGRLTQAFVRIAATLDRSVIIQRSALDDTKPRSISRRILESAADGVILYCEEHPAILRAIESLARRRVPVVCLTTDLPTVSRLAYVGIDHRRAGRTAALFASLAAQGHGSALVLTASLGYRAHRERVEGFETGLAEYAPEIRILPVLHGHDERETSYRLVRRALLAEPGISALYNTGGVNRAVAAALRETGRVGQVAFVGHELTETSAALLRERVMVLAIDQAPELQAQRAIEIMLKHLGMFEPELPSSAIPFTLHTRENA